MHHIIATDEAGYGPNLGPLVIGATRWETENEDFDFQSALSEFVFDQKSKLSAYEKRNSASGLMIADSKAVYSSGKIELLERGVLASLIAIHESIPGNVEELMVMLGVDANSIQDSEYFQCHDAKLPLTSDSKQIEILGQRFAKSLAADGAAIKQLGVAIVFPKRFNEGVEEHGNKASCLTAESLGLIKSMIDDSQADSGDRFDIRCDKHGGRNRYAPSIAEHFGDTSVTTEVESRPCSRYGFQNGKAKIEFISKGESWLPIALASMCAKYVREIYMQRWNQYWQIHVPHLKPTKGYPVDAKRFIKDIASKQKQFGIADAEIWRMR
jgi:ribonuclease HII